MIAFLHSLFLRGSLTLTIAFRALYRNKLRTCLTALGIIIGVGSVVTMVAFGNGARAMIQKEVSALGSNLLTVASSSRRATGGGGDGNSSNLTLADAQAIRREISGIVAMSPEVSVSAQAVANGRNWQTTVAGQSPEYLKIRDWNLVSGSMFTGREIRSSERVAVIGSKVSRELFGPLDPVGQTIRIKGLPFTIIGLLEKKGAGIAGPDQDDRIIVPYTTAMRRLTGERYPRRIYLQIESENLMETAQQQISSLLRQRHLLSDGRKDDFEIMNQKEIADTLSKITGVLTLFLGAVAGLSLLVGGVGIMNIMLVSVTERTREIGTRIAVGARPADILVQFLIESITLSLFGGALGVLLGYGCAFLGTYYPGLHPKVTMDSILLAFGVSFSIGVFFGFYPARKAASMNPIDALRFE
jgi:putative ABC transport system permease protein